jgi:hypothetical protein
MRGVRTFLYPFIEKMFASHIYAHSKLPRPAEAYQADCMILWQRNLSKFKDPRFIAAYQKTTEAGGQFYGGAMQFRISVALWAAAHGTRLEGDFVECGVNTGMYSAAICQYVDFNNTGKSFYLFDTFEGIPPEQASQSEISKGRLAHNESYPDCFKDAKNTFAPYPKAYLIKGKVPDTLETVTIDKVAYLSIDMNIVYPEIEAIKYFWPKLVSGAVVLLDDYGWDDYSDQHDAMDAFAKSVGTEILMVPTGQGILLKP